MVPRDPGAQAKTALQIRLTGGRPIPGSGPAAQAFRRLGMAGGLKRDASACAGEFSGRHERRPSARLQNAGEDVVARKTVIIRLAWLTGKAANL